MSTLPTYLINLRRRPEKLIKTLWTNDNLFQELNFDLRVIEAVDGTAIATNPNTNSIPKKFQESPGAFGYVLTWEKIIEEAIKKRHSQILILDDDVVCHRDILSLYSDWFHNNIYNQKYKRVPKIILLGASQHSFKNINLQNPDFYHPKHTDGSFAVILHNSIYDDLLKLLKTHQKLVDSHCLRDIYRKYFHESYVITPNLIIADVKHSDIRESRSQTQMAQIFRWDLSHYLYPLKMPWVSIIIPSYKSERTIARCLESMISQTYRPLEIIVVDDGSPDGNYQQICRTFQRWLYDPRANPKNFHFSVHKHEQNRGCYAARNTGLKLTKGDIIGFQDADDISLDNRIMEEVRALLAERVELVCCQFLRTHLKELSTDPDQLTQDLKRTRIHKKFGKQHKDPNMNYEYCCRAKIALATTIFRRSLFERLGYYDESLKWGGDAEYLKKFIALPESTFIKHTIMSYLNQTDKIKNKYYQVKEILYLSHEMNEQNLTTQRLKSEANSSDP